MSKPCSDCKGTGKTSVTIVDYTVKGPVKESRLEINCIRCDGTGEDIGRVFMEDLVTWCRCKQEHDAIFVDDGRCAVMVNSKPCPATKHHWHCTDCHGVTQIG